MDYALLFSAMGVSILWLWMDRNKVTRELNKAKMIAALLIAEKMGLKVDGERFEIELTEEREL